MSIEAEIEETVSAFIAGLMDLVRETALETVREALGKARAPAAPPGRAKRAPASLRGRSVGPATVRSSQLSFLDDGGGERVKVRSSTGAGSPLSVGRNKPAASVRAAAAPPPPVVVRRIPPRRRREGRAAAPRPPVELAPAPPVPAKNWVVVRRPARERGDAVAATGLEGGHTGAPPAGAAPPAVKPRSLRKPPVGVEGPASVPPVTAASSSGKPRSRSMPPVAEAGTIAAASPAPRSVRKPRVEPDQSTVEAKPRSVRKPSAEPRSVRKPSAENGGPRSAKPEAPAASAKSRDLPT